MSNEWFSKHVDTVVILGGILACFLWMNHRFSGIETRLTKIETVLILQKIMPHELCAIEKENKK